MAIPKRTDPDMMMDEEGRGDAQEQERRALMDPRGSYERGRLFLLKQIHVVIWTSTSL